MSTLLLNNHTENGSRESDVPGGRCPGGQMSCLRRVGANVPYSNVPACGRGGRRRRGLLHDDDDAADSQNTHTHTHTQDRLTAVGPGLPG